MNDMVQGSQEWLHARLGHCTASRFKDVLAKVKSGEAAARRNYKTQLVLERLTGAMQDSYTNAAMQHGTETEPLARAAYEFFTDAEVVQTGFVRHPSVEFVGASPDGLVGDDGGIEIKCPFQSAVHLETLLSGVPSEHIPQIQGTLWVTGRQWWDFVSFDPRMPEHLQCKIIRVVRDQAYIEELELAVRKFLSEVDALINHLRAIA